MAALCQAVETKDRYTRDHSERVSRGAVWPGSVSSDPDASGLTMIYLPGKLLA